MWKKKNQNLKEEQSVRNKLIRFYILFFFLCSAIHANSEHSFCFNQNLLVAQQQNYELRLDRARTILVEQQSLDVDNSAVHYLLHLNAFLKAFITEEQIDYIAYRKVQDAALLHYEQLPDTLAFKRFAQSDAYFFSATLKIKYEEFYGAARDVNKANNLINENQELFPDFLPNNKTRGILKIYLSTVPDNYAWVVKMLGIQGDLSEGLQLLKDLAQTNADTGYLKYLSREAAYFYSFSLLHIAKRPAKAWSETLRCTGDYRTNLMSTYLRSTMAMKLSKNDLAIDMLELRPTSKEFERFYYLDYLLGVAKLNKLDVTSILDLHKFKTNFKGRNYVKSCLMKMSWYYTITGNDIKAKEYQTAISKQGYNLNEDDKQAVLFGNKELPHKILLKARLLYDGGYTAQASQVIGSIDPKKLHSRQLKAEYCYRRGRILEKDEKTDKALKLYEACSLYGIDSEEYYAAYASIYLGDYYLKQGDKTEAKKFYERALTFKNNKEYTGSINQRAKTGLSRLK